MACDIHLTSLLVHARPTRLKAVCARIRALGCEVHATSPEGKIIVTLESGSDAHLSETLTSLQLLPDVFAATLVFHHVEHSRSASATPDPTAS